LNGDVSDHTQGWARRWSKRYFLYCAFAYPLVTAVYIPFNYFFVGFTADQWVRWFETGFLYSLPANIAIGPYAKWVWRSIWNVEHGVRPWYREQQKIVRQPL
jgi:hypothetical protein